MVRHNRSNRTNRRNCKVDGARVPASRTEALKIAIRPFCRNLGAEHYPDSARLPRHRTRGLTVPNLAPSPLPTERTASWGFEVYSNNPNSGWLSSPFAGFAGVFVCALHYGNFLST